MMPLQTSLYDITKTFEENVAYGPQWSGRFPVIPQPRSKATFFGQKVNSLFGAPACPLTVNARSIRILSQLGYDILTYKSVRSVEWHGNTFPNWAYVDAPKFCDTANADQLFRAQFESFGTAEPTMANSFGIHSLRPEYWQEDVERALQSLLTGQVLILSLMCTPFDGEKLLQDAKRLAKLANETSVNFFELNLACPNTDGGRGLIYEDLTLSTKLCVAVKKILGNKSLLVKVGYYQNQKDIDTFLKMTKGIISGISSTNTYSMKVTAADGREFFPGRPTAGISGAAIRNLSMQQAAKIVSAKQALDLKNFVVIGIGGVTQPKHIQEYLDLGVDAVQSAVGVWANPLLAYQYKKKL